MRHAQLIIVRDYRKQVPDSVSDTLPHASMLRHRPRLFEAGSVALLRTSRGGSSLLSVWVT